MKKLLFLCCLLMVFSCQTSDETSESKTDLEVHLQAIEKSIVSNQFEVNEDYKISNVEFFEEIEKLKSSENHNRDFKVSKNSYKSSESYPQEISKEEEAIILSYFRSLQIMEGNSVDITVFYINKLESLPLTIDEKKRLEESFTIIKDWFVYLDYDAIDTGKSSTKQSWAPCAHRDCLDCCMYRKLQELESSNIVQKTWFVITAAWSTAEMASVCGYDCLFG